MDSIWKFNLSYFQLAEALYEYGRGNDKKALELLGPDFDANAYKVLLSNKLILFMYAGSIQIFKIENQHSTCLCYR